MAIQNPKYFQLNSDQERIQRLVMNQIAQDQRHRQEALERSLIQGSNTAQATQQTQWRAQYSYSITTRANPFFELTQHSREKEEERQLTYLFRDLKKLAEGTVARPTPRLNKCFRGIIKANSK